MKEKMNIVMCLNSKYVFPSMVCILSVLKNNNVPVDVYILHSDLTEGEINYFNNSIKKYSPSTNLNPIKVGPDIFKGCPINGRAKEAYYRLLIPWFLPSSLSRCLYLDSDIIVNKSIVDYYNLDFQGKALIASEDIGEIIFFHKEQHSTLGIPPEYRYFNSGVLCFDLDYIRNNFKLADIFSFIEKKSQYLKFLDQDVLNGLFYNKVRLISGSSYNYPEILINPLITNNGLDKAVIIHFLQKPWKYSYRGVNQNLWWRYAREISKKKYYSFCVKNLFYRKTLSLLLIFFSIDFLKKIVKSFK